MYFKKHPQHVRIHARISNVNDKIDSEIQAITAILDGIVRNTNGY